MLATCHRAFVQPLVAARRRSSHLRHLRRLERSQFDPPAAVAEAQLDALRAALDFAYATVPYYRRAWDAAGVHPADVRTPADLAAFPVLTKSDLRAHAAELLSAVGDRSKWRHKSTSGSTGVPLRIRLDEAAAQYKTAVTLRSDEWSGWRRGERVAKVWGNPEYRADGWRGRLRNALVDRATHLDTIRLTDARIRAFGEALRKSQPGLVFGHAHSLYLVAKRFEQLGLAGAVRPNGVISTAMPLHAWQRPVIERVFGVRVTDRYGCEETSLIACECERHDGLHVAAESVYVESVQGRLLLTDLANRAMPLIRYRVGDAAELEPAPCPCGRGLPRLKRVEGREADYVVTPDGSLISGISLTENFAMHIPGVAQLQIVQESRTRLLLRLVRDTGFGDASHARIRELVLKLFGPAMRHEVEFVDAIEQEPSGKYRFCVSKVSAEEAMS